jgi:hypothetical protein
VSSGRHDDILVSIQGMRGVQSMKMNKLTGNMLVHYDTTLTDAPAILDVLQSSALAARRAGSGPLGLTTAACQSPDSWSGISASNGKTRDARPDPARVILPVIHLVYSCSPVGATLHVGELAWAIGTRAGRVRVAFPVLHLILSCHPLGMVLHMGELAWALTPFLAPDRTQRPLAPTTSR